MFSRVLSLTFVLAFAAASSVEGQDRACSQPSRMALYERDGISRCRAPRASKQSSASLQRRTARQTKRRVAAQRSRRVSPAKVTVFEPVAIPTPEPLPLAGPVASLPSAERELALQPTSFTPYDRYLGVVRDVIDEVQDTDSSVGAACRLMREAHSFRYVAQDPYRANPPAVTSARRAGDCKAKALWLYDRLGDPGALYVIGKVTKRAQSSHAWVYWRYQSRWWILDPTNRSGPLAADSVSSSRYVPYYSLGKSGTYRHPATQLLLATSGNLATPTPAVASRILKSKRAGEKRKRRR